jgi:hypothetical protein
MLIFLNDSSMDGLDVFTSEDVPPEWESSGSSKALNLLKLMLEREKDIRYYKAAVEQMFEMDRDIFLPAWLVEFFRRQNPEELIQLFIKYQAFHQGSPFIYNLLKDQMSLDPHFRLHSRWMPWTLLDHVKEFDNDNVTPLLDSYIQLLKEESRSMIL